ncbi:hypothetical protein ASE98_21270 [Pseudomonas sp. Leaf48]|uniref:EpsG family protein n=1 Tax=Pseudomonas sp. Leaf48 TaxID=1736221 RepID=UPI000725EF6F|nr:EpsG family protein [Pseudomonas sp. Leaf48]KQN52655.1 hypothetical protein ASE98_21270 [Pseudomonas sp. Leaf48]
MAPAKLIFISIENYNRQGVLWPVAIRMTVGQVIVWRNGDFVLFYIWLAIALVPMYFCELACGSRVKSFGLSVFFAFVYFVIVAGLRDDTGYDWYVYKFIYKGVSESGSLAAAISFGRDNGSELGFSVFLYALSLLGLSFWWVQFLVGIFNCYAFLRLNSVLGRGAVTGLLVYLCWLFLVLQMGVLRMSVALSFLSLALLFILKGKNVKFLLLVILASLFHTFSIVIGLLMLLARLSFPRTITLFFLFLFAVMYVAGIDLAGGVVQVVSGVMPEFVSSKLNFYLMLGLTYQRGVGEFLYKLVMVSMYVFLVFRIQQDKNEKLMLNLSYIYMIALLAFWKYPIFHDRLKYFALMPLFYLFFTIIMRMKVFNRLVCGVAFLMVSFMVLLHEVSGPLFFPYTPYYNMYERWLSGEGNDGEERTLKYYKEYDSQWLGGGQ